MIYNINGVFFNCVIFDMIENLCFMCNSWISNKFIVFVIFGSVRFKKCLRYVNYKCCNVFYKVLLWILLVLWSYMN